MWCPFYTFTYTFVRKWKINYFQSPDCLLFRSIRICSSQWGCASSYSHKPHVEIKSPLSSLPMVLCLTSPGACKWVSSAIVNLLLFRKSSAACSVSPLFATKRNSATVCGQSVRRLLPALTWAWVIPADRLKLTNLTHVRVWDKPVFTWSVKQKSSMLQCTLLTEEPRARQNERLSGGKLVLQDEGMDENYKPLYLRPHVHPFSWGSSNARTPLPLTTWCPRFTALVCGV